jgi:hypothetical protein
VTGVCCHYQCMLLWLVYAVMTRVCCCYQCFPQCLPGSTKLVLYLLVILPFGTLYSKLPTATLYIKRSPYNSPRRVHRGSRGIALLILDLSARRAWLVNSMPWPLYPREIPGTHCTGGWVGPRADLDVCEKSRPHWDSILGLSSP